MIPALHSVSCCGVWPVQERWDLPAFVRKASELSYGGVEFMAKRPHLSPLAYEMCPPFLGGGSMGNLDRRAWETLQFLVSTWEAV
ncbi:MAG: hypothetical protein AB7W28_12285 [Armatimonadota bacterium]